MKYHRLENNESEEVGSQVLELLQRHQAVTCPEGEGANPDDDVEVELDIGALFETKHS